MVYKQVQSNPRSMTIPYTTLLKDVLSWKKKFRRDYRLLHSVIFIHWRYALQKQDHKFFIMLLYNLKSFSLFQCANIMKHDANEMTT
jgi:hypothetical protein